MRKLSRLKNNRELLLKNLLTSLVMHGAIVTTEAKAKTLRPIAERALAQTQRGSLAERRQAATMVTTKEAVVKMSERAANLPSAFGNIKLVRTTPRVSDRAPQMAVIIMQKEVSKEEVVTTK